MGIGSHRLAWGCRTVGPGSRDGSQSADGGYEPGRLPLLAHALRATWQHRDGSRLTIAGYEATGGIAGAIARTAEDVYTRLDESGQAAARQIFLALVRVGQATGDGAGTADTRRRVAADSLLGRVADPVAARATLDAFTATRLLTSGGHAVEITHEALLRRWPRLRGWIDEDRSGLLVRQELEDAVATWAREGRDAAGLYGGARLATAQGWATDPAHSRELTPAGRDFLAASERRRRRGTRRRNGIIAVLAVLSLLLAALSVFALNQRSAAQTNYQNAEAGLLAAESGQAWSDLRPDTALKFAVEAGRLDPSSPQVRSALASHRVTATAKAPGIDGVSSVAFSPNGTQLAASDLSGVVRVWDVRSSPVLLEGFAGHQYPVEHIAYSPDRARLASASNDGTIALWDTRGTTLGGVSNSAIALAFSPDSRTLALSTTVPGHYVVALYSMPERKQDGLLPVSGIAALAFSPDGKALAVAPTNAPSDPAELWGRSDPPDDRGGHDRPYQQDQQHRVQP